MFLLLGSLDYAELLPTPYPETALDMLSESTSTPSKVEQDCPSTWVTLEKFFKRFFSRLSPFLPVPCPRKYFLHIALLHELHQFLSDPRDRDVLL